LGSSNPASEGLLQILRFSYFDHNPMNNFTSVKRQILLCSIAFGPIAIMRILWTIYGTKWLYFFSWSYIAWEIILVGCAFIFIPKKVAEFLAFIENIEYRPLWTWSEKHFTYIYFGIIVVALGVAYMYLFIQALVNNVFTQPP
jgi:hypothetical protein